jgi:hypothetical protein
VKDVGRFGASLATILLSHPRSLRGVLFSASLFKVLRSIDVIKKVFGAR